MIPASVMAKMAALGLSEEQAEAVAVMLSAVETATRDEASASVEQSRAKTRARVQAWRDRKASNVTERNETLRNGSREGVTRVEDISSTNKITGKEEKEERAPKARVDLDAFKAELLPILDADRLDALIAVRRKRGATFSAHAGRLLSKALRACSNIPEAADEMVLRNWTSVKPEWLEQRQRQSQGPPPKQTVGQQARDELKRMGLLNAPDEITRHENDGIRSPDFAGSGLARRIAIAPGGRGGH